MQASIPASQADALKALAAASGVPVARAVHYAVERLLDTARREGVLAVSSGLAPERRPEPADGSVAEVAEALDLRMPESGSGRAESVARNGVPLLGPAAEQDGAQPSERGTEQVAERAVERPFECGREYASEHASEGAAASPAERGADAAPYPKAGAAPHPQADAVV